MRHLTWKSYFVLFGLSVILATAVPTLGQQLIGTYRINYRYNTAGCFPPDWPNPTPTEGNPYYCLDPIGPGPYFINAAPGRYRAVVTGFSAASSARLWSGDASGGLRYDAPLDPPQVGVNLDFDHTFGQIVLYAWDWYVYDNDSSAYVDVALYSLGCEVPDGEVPTFAQWNPVNGKQTQAQFRVSLFSSAGTDFTGKTVSESTPNPDPTNDKCFLLAFSSGNTPPDSPNVSVTGNSATVGVQQPDEYFDTNGWAETAVEQYMQLLLDKGQQSCHTIIEQRMAMNCPDGSSKEYATNYLVETIIAPSNPRNPGRVVVTHCPKDDFDSVTHTCSDTASTTCRLWYAAAGRNRVPRVPA